MLNHLSKVTEQVDVKAQERTLFTPRQRSQQHDCADFYNLVLEDFCFHKTLDLNEAIHMGNPNPLGLGLEPRPECGLVACW